MTAQFHEGLIYEGKPCTMAFCPPLPVGHPRIAELTEEEMRESELDFICSSTGCWRQYIGEWEIKDGRFYLVKISGRFQLKSEEPLFADWFSGVLRITKGERLLYVHMGFGSVYEEELHVKIERGIVTKTRELDNRGKEFDEDELGWQNLPGWENRFPADDEI